MLLTFILILVAVQLAIVVVLASAGRAGALADRHSEDQLRAHLARRRRRSAGGPASHR